MQEQEKQEVVVAYKAFNKDLTCRDFQFEIGKTYEHDGKVVACESGFHACENPMDTWGYYDLTQSRFCTVELSGELCRHGEDSKVAAGRITLKAEIGLPQIITEAVKWMLAFVKDMPAAETASGDYSNLAASGDYSNLAASGDYSNLAASGNSSKLAASGNSSKLAASGKKSIAVASGLNCKASAGEDGCIALAWWDDDAKRFRLEVAYIGENGIEPNVTYELDEDHKFSKVEDES